MNSKAKGLRLNPDRIRAQLAVLCIDLARVLLGMRGPASGGFDTCIYCKAPGCESGEAEHKLDCPSVTGVFPVRLQEMWPAGPAQCDRCNTKLWPGDSYSHIEVEGGPVPVFEVACTGCAVLAEVEALQ